MGAQIRVDWGQTKQRTPENDVVKLYFISFVLSHSRYKYLEWLDSPLQLKMQFAAMKMPFIILEE